MKYVVIEIVANWVVGKCYFVLFIIIRNIYLLVPKLVFIFNNFWTCDIRIFIGSKASVYLITSDHVT